MKSERKQMAIYSITLRELVETYGKKEVKKWFTNYDLNDYLTSEEIAVISKRGTWSKDKLAEKIIDHYYMEEIGFETPALFKHQAKVAMQEIMEEKLPLIYSASIKYDPLVNVDYTETYERNSSGNSTSSSDGLNIHSDTPQGRVSKSEILSGTYATTTDGNELSDKTDTSGREDYTKKIKGNSGVSATAQKMVQQYRENIIMIDRDIINDLASLFMAIF